MLILRVHLVIEYLIVGLFFHFIIKNKIIKALIIFTVLPFIFYTYFDYMKFGNKLFGTLPTLIEFIFFILIIIVYFFEKMKTISVASSFSLNSIHFWISVGLFLYFTGNFFYFLFVENSKHANQSLKDQLNIIYSSVTIIKNIILGLAFVNNQNDEYNKASIDFPGDSSWDPVHQQIKT